MIQNSLIVMLVDTVSSIEAGYCGAGTHPFPRQTRVDGEIRLWLMRTFRRRLQRTVHRGVFHRASGFRLVTKSMRLTFRLDGHCLRQETLEFRF